MNLETQLRGSSFDDIPVVKEGLTLAKTFIENRHGLFKSLNDDDATVQTHVSGDNLPPVIPLHGGGKARRSDLNMSLMKEPHFSDVYKMPTTAEGGVRIVGDFTEKLRGACTFPKNDLRRRVYVVMVACGYIHELLAHSKVRRLYVKVGDEDQFRSKSDKVGYYAEELLFGGSLHIKKMGIYDEYTVALASSEPEVFVIFNVDVELGVVEDKTIRAPATEQYISLLESILRGECQFEEGELRLRDAVMKSLGIAELPEAKRQDDSDDDWPDWPDSGPWVPSWTRTPDIVSLESPAKNELVIEIQDTYKKPFALYLRGECEKQDVFEIDDDGTRRVCSHSPKRLIDPGRSEYKIDELFRIQEHFDYIDVTVGIGSIFEDYIRVEL